MKLRTVQNNFTGGVLGPLLYARADTPRYQSGIAIGRNAIVIPTGGITRRPGTRFAGDEGVDVVVRKFAFQIFRKDLTPPINQGYDVVFRSDNKIRFYSNNARIEIGGNPYEIISPFTDANLSKIRAKGNDNVLYLVHPDFPPQKLYRDTSDTDWKIEQTVFKLPEQITIAQVNRSGSKAVVITKAQAVDSITLSGTTATVTTVKDHGYSTGQKIVITGAEQPEYNGTYEITTAGGKTFTYQVDGSPATPANKQSITSLVSDGAGTATATTSAAHGYATGNQITIAGASPSSPYNGVKNITVTSPTTFTYGISGTPTTPATGTITATHKNIMAATTHGFSTGQIVTMAGADQTEYNGTFQVKRESDTEFSYQVTGAPVTPGTGEITAQLVHWHGDFGFPASICFNEQRMILGPTYAQPYTIWGSKIGELDDLITGINEDSAAFVFTIAEATTPIKHLEASDRKIVAFTNDIPFFIQGSADNALTATNVRIKAQRKYGISDNVPPLDLGNDLLFVTKYGKSIRGLSYKFETDTFEAPDKGFIAHHLLESGIKVWAYSSEPHPVVWIITNDGKLVAAAWGEEGAFTECDTEGLCKDLCVISTADKDQLWLAVEREVNGITKLYNEYLDIEYHSYANTDCAYVDTDVTGKKIWSGFDHLEGKTVDILADDIEMPQQVVSSGTITLSRNANKVEAGLHYETELKDLPVGFMPQLGIVLGMKINVHEIKVLLHKTLGCNIAGEDIPFRQFGDNNLDAVIEPYSGFKTAGKLGWDNGAITIKQTHPLPCTVLGIFKQVSIND